MLTIIRVAADPIDHQYTEHAYHSLLSLAQIVPKSESGLSADLLVSTLVQLGAKLGACPELSQVPPCKRISGVASEQRERTLYRILSIVTAFARYVISVLNDRVSHPSCTGRKHYVLATYL